MEPDPSQYLTPAKLSRFKHFEMLAHTVVEGMLTGLHRSPYKGYAVEFAEHREYSPGDDLKYLDWKLYGKFDRFYIRQFEEDTSMRAYLLLDCSGSMAYRSGQYAKIDLGRFICGVLSYVLHLQNDSIGLLTFDSDIRNQLIPRSSRRHLKEILDSLTHTKCGHNTGIAQILHKLANQLHKRALVVIVSDFFDDLDEIKRALTHFAQKKHNVVIFQTLDRNEVEFPFEELLRFESLETGHSLLCDPVRVRREYLKHFQAHVQELKKICYQLEMEYNQFLANDPFEPAIAKYLSGRLKR